MICAYNRTAFRRVPDITCGNDGRAKDNDLNVNKTKTDRRMIVIRVLSPVCFIKCYFIEKRVTLHKNGKGKKVKS